MLVYFPKMSFSFHSFIRPVHNATERPACVIREAVELEDVKSRFGRIPQLSTDVACDGPVTTRDWIYQQLPISTIAVLNWIPRSNREETAKRKQGTGLVFPLVSRGSAKYSISDSG